MSEIFRTSNTILNVSHGLVNHNLSVSALHVLRGVGEGGAVLGGGVLRPMWSDVAQDHHHRAVRVHFLRRAEVVNALVCDDVSEVVLQREQNDFDMAHAGNQPGLILNSTDLDLLCGWLELRASPMLS